MTSMLLLGPALLVIGWLGLLLVDLLMKRPDVVTAHVLASGGS